MHDPGMHVGSRHTMPGQESVHIAAKVLSHYSWHIGREHDLESFLGNIPAHYIQGVGIEGTSAIEDFCASKVHLIAGHQDSSCAIAEQAGGDEVGYLEVLALPSQRAKLNGEKQSYLVGIGAHIIGSSGQAGGSRNTTETKNWVPLDARSQAQPIDQSGIKRRAADTGHGNEKKSANFLPIQNRLLEDRF